MPTKSRCATFIFIAALFAGPVTKSWAQDMVVELPGTKETFILTPGVSKSLEVKRPFKTITVANPNIVEAIARSDRVVYLVPKARGVTNISFIDDKQEQIADVLILVEPDVFESHRDTMHLTLGLSTSAAATRPFKSWLIANPNIVEAVRETDSSVVLKPLEDGATSIDFLDEQGRRVGSFDINVSPQAADASSTQVRIYNQKVLSGVTLFACTGEDCQLGKEIIPKTQGLAAGRTEQSVNQTVDQSIRNLQVPQTPEQAPQATEQAPQATEKEQQ